MFQDIKKYIQECDICQRKKIRARQPVRELQTIEVPSAPWTVVSNDFIVELPKLEGNTAVWVVVDLFSKEAHFVPLPGVPTAEETAGLYLKHIWKLHGIPEQMISDRGPQFTSHLMKGLFERLGVEGAYSTTCHPQTDGQTERVNQELKQYL